MCFFCLKSVRAALVLSLLLTHTSSSAEIYRWVDANGVTQYSEETPSDAGDQTEAEDISAKLKDVGNVIAFDDPGPIDYFKPERNQRAVKDGTPVDSTEQEPVLYEKCEASLDSLSVEKGFPNDRFYMYGRWGREQGEKLVVINKGHGHDLIVVSWRRDVLAVRVPSSLEPGTYRVGVYCNDPFDPEKGGTYSSGFRDFEVLDAENQRNGPKTFRSKRRSR